jgi:hypothetical protein
VGTFDAGEVNPDGMYSVVTNFEIVIDGVTYNEVDPLLGLFLSYNYDGSAPMLSGALIPGPSTSMGLQFAAGYYNGVPNPQWGLRPCDENGCSVSTFMGTYSVLPGGHESVPEPATAALFGLGLAGVAAVRRRRARQT